MQKLRFAILGSLALALSAATPLAAQQGNTPDAEGRVTSAEVQKEVREAVDAISKYSAEQREEAVREAQEALADLDRALEQREAKLRQEWGQLSEKAQEQAAETQSQLQEYRQRLGEWYGALKHGSKQAWQEMKTGFAKAYDELEKAWKDADPSQS